jgi:hypothetical protein
MQTRFLVGLAAAAFIGGCAQVLGLEPWMNPRGATGGSATGSGGAGGDAGNGGAGGGAGAPVTSSTTSSGELDGGLGDGNPPTCFDGIQDGMESDVDCGGDSCPECGAGKKCNDGADCASGQCTDGRCAAEAGPPMCMPSSQPTCNDCVQDGSETDVDCGGDACLPCGAGKKCNDDADCISGHCNDGHCATGVSGQACQTNADCASGHCAVGACFTGACCR